MKKTATKTLKNVRTLTLIAMLTAMSVVIGIFCKSFLNFGGGLFRITFENLPIILTGFLFGPILGGVVGIASDMISYLLSGQMYPPNLIVTLGAAAVGVVSGIVFRLCGKKKKTVSIVLSAATAHVVGSMIIKPIGLFQFYGWATLWRIPLYALLIAPAEILILCLLFRNKNFCRLTDIE
ncbi:MAG: folate family ECF transporter S component [Ruminococcaceae bacterium]|nr:folate family ECF transporter S component [Oscillospiraceae bacterium]